jgi:hypothetical protein
MRPREESPTAPGNGAESGQPLRDGNQPQPVLFPQEEQV